MDSIKIFKVTFEDEISAESEQEAYDKLLVHLRDIVKYQDVTAFEFKEIAHHKNCLCQECCTHDNTECGHCIDCGAELELEYNREPELNPDR